MKATKSKARKQDEAEPTKQERQTVIYQMVTDKIVAALNRGDIPWQRPWRPADAQRNIYGRPYRGVNQFLLQLEAQWKGYKSPFWMTFNHAKEMGGMGSSGKKIYFIKQPA